MRVPAGQGRRGRLEAVDRLDRQRVDAARLGELEADQVAEHQRPEQAFGAALAGGLDADRRRPPSASIAAAVSSKRRRTRGCWSRVLEHHRGEPPRSPGRRPSRRSRCGRPRAAREERRQLRVLVDLGLPAPGDRARSGRRRRSTGTAPVERGGDLRGAARGAPPCALEEAPRRPRSRCAMRGATPASGGDLGGADEHVGDARCAARAAARAGRSPAPRRRAPTRPARRRCWRRSCARRAPRRPRSRRASPRSRPSSSSRGRPTPGVAQLGSP